MQQLAERMNNFWYGTADSPSWGEWRSGWCGSAWDEDLRKEFLDDWNRLMKGEYDDETILATPETTLGAILVLDQVGRCIFREQPEAWAGDEKAASLCLKGIEKGYLDAVTLVTRYHRFFFLLPLMHAENLDLQNMCVEMLGEQSKLAAVNHRDIVERFGRFPTRNAPLGRVSTPEEEDFLKNEWSGFMKKEGYLKKDTAV